MACVVCLMLADGVPEAPPEALSASSFVALVRGEKRDKAAKATCHHPTRPARGECPNVLPEYVAVCVYLWRSVKTCLCPMHLLLPPERVHACRDLIGR
jgi:hypothetical protein